jgi:hypothetical protein
LLRAHALTLHDEAILAGTGLARYEHRKAGRAFKLSRIDPDERPCASGDKTADKAEVEQLALELDQLQNLFWANRRHKMLVVLQGWMRAARMARCAACSAA